MVLRALWNAGAGLALRLLTKRSMRPGLAVAYPAVWKGRAGLLDCDVNLHLNNSAYLYAMELARWHFTGATGILFQALRKRRAFLAASQAIRFRRAVPPLAPYEIHTRIVFWDDRWIYFLHSFQCPRSRTLFAEGLVRVTVRGPGGEAIAGRDVFAEVEPDPRVLALVPSDMPDVVKGFLDWDAASRDSMEAAEAQAKQQVMEKKGEDQAPPTSDLWSRLRRELARSTNSPFHKWP